jgi:hypothetical protein
MFGDHNVKLVCLPAKADCPEAKAAAGDIISSIDRPPLLAEPTQRAISVRRAKKPRHGARSHGQPCAALATHVGSRSESRSERTCLVGSGTSRFDPFQKSAS